VDVLQPYIYHHGPKYRSHREVRECQDVKYGNVTHSKIKSHGFHDNLKLPLAETRHIIREVKKDFFNSKDVNMHYTVVNNPYRTVSVLEPGGLRGSCEKSERATVLDSAKQKNCIVAVNAGFFNTKNGACLGNIISDGRLVMDSGGVQNAHFGITKSGDIYSGYLSEIDLIAEDFTELVGGVIWLIRDGESYIEESIDIECSDTQETGTLRRFVDVISSRTAIGHDKDGRVLIMQADGKTNHEGITLKEFVDILLDFGFVNAINLDGGGSSTYVVNGTVVNYPSDQCKDDRRFNCERIVSTVVCVHEPECSPLDCSGHGTCVLGTCECEGYWSGKSCDQLMCPGQCSGHGTCSEEGCSCEAGFHGISCNMTCSSGYYGNGCQHKCTCIHGNGCDPVKGTCYCLPGYSGIQCENTCPYGTYGENCTGKCECGNNCPCHPINGSCNFTDLNLEFLKGKINYQNHSLICNYVCLISLLSICRSFLVAVITLSAIGVISLILNLVLGYKVFNRTKSRRRNSSLPESQQLYKIGCSDSEDELSSFSDYPMQENVHSGKKRKKKKLRQQK
ncbi:hypothetical protein FSP39_003398, partial [Pinctada imbricata]